MSIQPLLDRIPFAHKAGVQCESYAPGRVVLSLALTDSNKNHAGTMHAAGLFTVAETAGAAVCSTHPRLSGLQLLEWTAPVQAHRGMFLTPCVGDAMASKVVRASPSRRRVSDGGMTSST